MNAIAYRNLIERTIYRVANRYSISFARHEVEDILQDTLLVLWQCPSVAHVQSLEAYVAQTARNMTIDALRRGSAKKRGPRRFQSLDDVAEPSGRKPTPERELLAKEALAHRLRRCRRLLSADSYRILCLVYVRGLSSIQVGEILGMSRTAIDTSVHRARLRLRQAGLELEPRGRL